MEISVIIPVYNAEEFLKQAVDSAARFDEVTEILLIEDGSSDNSLQVASKLAQKNPKLKILRHENGKNKGAGASRNLGIQNSSNPFIAFLDADDVFLPNRFEFENEAFKNPEIEGVFGALGQNFLTANAKSQFQSKFKDTSLTTVNFPAEGKEIFSLLMEPDSKFGSFFHLDTLTIKKESLLKNNLFFNEKLKLHQDQDFITKLAFHVHLQTGIIDRPVALRGVHDDNRITKIKNYSLNYNKNQLLLWESLDSWAQDKEISGDIKEFIQLKHKAFQIGSSKGVDKYLKMIKSTISNPKILKTRYRFHFQPKEEN